MVEDLFWMRENGIEDVIIEVYCEGFFVVGICGGF